MKFYGFLVILSFLMGCSSPKPGLVMISGPPEDPSTPTSTARIEVAAILEDEIYSFVGFTKESTDTPTDEFYICLTAEQFSEMQRWVGDHIETIYIPNAADCDDFAFESLVFSRRWCRNKITSGSPISLAFFVAYIRVYSGAFEEELERSFLHAVNLVRFSDGSWYLWEPFLKRLEKLPDAVWANKVDLIKVIW